MSYRYRRMNIFSYTARVLLCNVETFLTYIPSLSNVEIMRLSSKELSNLLLYDYPNFSLVTNRAIVESIIKFIKSTSRVRTN